MASNDLGYEEERFVTTVNRNFHCLICFNVLKDPVMCRRNQHCFCRGCITVHLRVNAQRCPTCADDLTLDTLSDAPRMVKDYLSELNIHCDHSDRGCQEIVQLQHLDRHVATCGFEPVVCANQGCGVTVNKRDRIHHESELCEYRRLLCHNCDEINKTMAEIQNDVAKVQVNMARVETRKANVEKNVASSRAEVTNIKTTLANLETRVTNMETNLTNIQKSTATNAHLIAEMQRNSGENFVAVNKEVRELKAILTAVKGGFESLKETVLEKIEGKERQQEDNVRHIRGAESDTKEKQNIIVAGGVRDNSVEIYNIAQKSWSMLQSMPRGRFAATSFVYNNHMIVAGGYCHGYVDDMIQLDIDPTPDPSTHWSNFGAKLPDKLAGHSSVVYKDNLFLTGGENGGTARSDLIHEVQLKPPYSVKPAARLPEPRAYHGTELFDDKILIFGGRKTGLVVNSVLLYDINKKEYQEMSALPYPVWDMATVTWGDNVVVIGGKDKDGKILNTVVIYNTKTGDSHMLPSMKYKRSGCSAAVVGNTIVVIGGSDQGVNGLKSVECFTFDRYTWEELPEMNKGRYCATAVVI